MSARTHTHVLVPELGQEGALKVNVCMCNGSGIHVTDNVYARSEIRCPECTRTCTALGEAPVVASHRLYIRFNLYHFNVVTRVREMD